MTLKPLFRGLNLKLVAEHFGSFKPDNRQSLIIKMEDSDRGVNRIKQFATGEK